MAENPYVNRVETADGTTIMDISDTTATAGDVVSGTVFYTASGARSVGSLNVSGYVVGPSSATDSHVAAFDGTTGKLIKDSGYTIGTSVPSNAVFTDHTYTAGTGLTLSGSEFSANVYNGLDKSDSGYALDARQGKALSDSISLVKDSTNLGTFSTIAELETVLNNTISGMDTYTVMTFRVYASATVGPFTNTFIYYGSLYKGASTNNYCHVVMYSNASTNIITGVKASGSWSFYIEATRDYADSAVSTMEGNHFGTLGSSSDPITSRNSIPLNWIGNVVFDASVSPSGLKRSHSVIKWGLNSTRYCILAIDQYANKMYLFENYDGTIIAWRSIEPDSIFMRSETLIPSNSDMDDYNTPGVYTVASAAVAATISNIPYTSSGGRLEVIGQNSNSSYQRQMYYPNSTANIYTRNRGSSTWGSWYRINVTQV